MRWWNPLPGALLALLPVLLPGRTLAGPVTLAGGAVGGPAIGWGAAIGGAFSAMRPLDPRLEPPALVNLSRLDYRLPHNEARLEPVIIRLELSAPAFPLTPEAFAAMTPEAKRRLLVQVVGDQRKDTDRRGLAVLNAIQFGIRDAAAPRLYREAERLALVETPYVAPGMLARLQAALPRLLERKKIYEERQRREREEATRRARAAAERLEDDARGWEAGGDARPFKPEGPTELDRDIARSAEEWEGRLSKGYQHPNERKGLRPASQPSDGDIPEPAEPAYPLSRIRSQYLSKAAEAAQARDGVRFWRLSDAAFADMEGRVQDELSRIQAIGRLGPRSRERIRQLREQARRLKEELRRIKARHNLPGSHGSRYARRASPAMDGLDGGEQAVQSRIFKLDMRLDRRNYRERESGWFAANEAERLREESDGSVVAPLLRVADYYRTRLKQGDADSDSGHIQEILRNLVQGRKRRYGGADFPPLAVIRKIWDYARREPGNLRPLAVNAVLGLAAAAGLLYVLWALPAVPLAGAVKGLLAAAGASGLYLSWRAYSRLRRFRRLGAEFDEVQARFRDRH